MCRGTGGCVGGGCVGGGCVGGGCVGVGVHDLTVNYQ